MTLHNFTLTGQTPLAIASDRIEILGGDLGGLEVRAYIPLTYWPSSKAEADALFDRCLVAYDEATGRRLSGRVRLQGYLYQKWYVEAILSPEEPPTP